MRRTSIKLLALTAPGVALAGLVVLRWLDARGFRAGPGGWIEEVAILALAGVILWLGWTVRSYQKGNRPNLDPIRAARTFVLAKAGALTGAILTGRYLASALVVAGNLDVASQRNRAIGAGIAMLCAIALTVAALVAEKFCELPPPDDDEDHGPEAVAG